MRHNRVSPSTIGEIWEIRTSTSQILLHFCQVTWKPGSTTLSWWKEKSAKAAIPQTGPCDQYPADNRQQLTSYQIKGGLFQNLKHAWNQVNKRSLTKPLQRDQDTSLAWSHLFHGGNEKFEILIRLQEKVKPGSNRLSTSKEMVKKRTSCKAFNQKLPAKKIATEATETSSRPRWILAKHLSHSFQPLWNCLWELGLLLLVAKKATFLSKPHGCETLHPGVHPGLKGKHEDQIRFWALARKFLVKDSQEN